MHALAILFVIKFKIIIVASIVAFGIYYYTKFLPHKRCGEDSLLRTGVVEPAYVYKTRTAHQGHFHSFSIEVRHFLVFLLSSRYSSPSISITPYSSYIPADVSSYSSYPGIEPYAGYHDSHSDISYDHPDHHFHDSHHHHHDHEHDYEHSFDASNYALPSASLLPNTDNVNLDMSAGPNLADVKPETSHTYRRVGKHRKRRQAPRPQLP